MREEEYAQFIQYHVERRSGERRRRLEQGHGHAEALFAKHIWFPLRGNFDGLHPEYEVLDWRGRSYFADFAWLMGLIRLVIEIKGYTSHVRNMDRWKYCNELNRETFMHSMGYSVISFAYDDVEQRPELCIQLLRMVLARYLPEVSPILRAAAAEKEVIRLAIQLAKPIRPKDVEKHFEIDHKTAVKMIQSLCDKGWLSPLVHGQGERIKFYQLHRNAVDCLD